MSRVIDLLGLPSLVALAIEEDHDHCRVTAAGDYRCMLTNVFDNVCAHAGKQPAQEAARQWLATVPSIVTKE